MRNVIPRKMVSTRKIRGKTYYYVGRTLFWNKAELEARNLKDAGIGVAVTRRKDIGYMIWSTEPVYVDLSEPIYNPTTKVHPLAIEAKKKWKEDMKAGHGAGEEYWAGYAGAAYLMSNPAIKRYFFLVSFNFGGKMVYERIVASSGSEAIKIAKEGKVPGLTNWKAEKISGPVITGRSGNPLAQFCCSICDRCAPKSTLPHGKFEERMSWLRKHYQRYHPKEFKQWGKNPIIETISTKPSKKVNEDLLVSKIINIASRPVPRNIKPTRGQLARWEWGRQTLDIGEEARNRAFKKGMVV